MKTFQKLTIPSSIITQLKYEASCSNATGGSGVFRLINSLPVAHRVELLALYMLGRGGARSLNLTLKSASGYNPDHIAGMLSDNSKLVQYINKGIQRYLKHS